LVTFSYRCRRFSWIISLQRLLILNTNEYHASQFVGCAQFYDVSFASSTIVPQELFANLNTLQTASIPKAITIDALAFFNITISTISIIDVISVGYQAFAYSALNSISGPSLKTVGNGAILGNSNFTAIDLLTAVSIGTSVFAEDSALVPVNFPVASTIGQSAILNCISLVTLSLDASEAGYLSGPQFAGCTLLTGVSLGSSKIMPPFIFENETSLTNANANQVTEIQTGASLALAPLVLSHFAEVNHHRNPSNYWFV
jgi:hypothetical protein